MKFHAKARQNNNDKITYQFSLVTSIGK